MNGDKGKTPESVTGARDGFLSTLWAHREGLRPMSKTELALYFTRRGLETLMYLPMSSILTTVTIGSVLFLLSSMMLVFENAHVFIANAGGGRQFTVYLKDGAISDDVLKLSEEIRSYDLVEDTDFVTKEDAIDLFKEYLGPYSELMKGLEKENPLPASIDVFLKVENIASGDLAIEHMSTKIKQSPIVESIVYSSEWANRIQSFLHVSRLLSAIFLFIALIVGVFIITSTIRLLIAVFKDEISIMRLMGAARAYVSLPFILGGFIQGFVGSLFGLVALKVVFTIMVTELSQTQFFGMVLPSVRFLSFFDIMLALVIGSVAGLLGSFLALRRYVHI